MTKDNGGISSKKNGPKKTCLKESCPKEETGSEETCPKKTGSEETCPKKIGSKKMNLKIRLKKPDSKGKKYLTICLKRPGTKKYKEIVSSTDEMPMPIGEIDRKLEQLKTYHELFSYEEELSPEEVVDGSNEFVDDSNELVSSIDNEVSLLNNDFSIPPDEEYLPIEKYFINEILSPGKPDVFWNRFLYEPSLSEWRSLLESQFYPKNA